MAAAFSAIKGPPTRLLCSCKARAISSLPVPDSPVINTVTLEAAKRPMARNTSCMAGDDDCTMTRSALTVAAGDCAAIDSLEPVCAARCIKATDRKSVVSGKSVAVRGDLGGRRNIKKKNKKQKI